MSFCSKCGKEIEEGVKFCPSCGAQTGAANAQVQAPQQSQTPTDFDKDDVEKNKVMGILSYLGILVLIPILAAKDSPYARFHANQGLILCIAAILYSVAYSVLSAIILAISWRLYFIVSILGFLGIIFLVLCIIGIINAANGSAKELPFIGKYRVLK